MYQDKDQYEVLVIVILNMTRYGFLLVLLCLAAAADRARGEDGTQQRTRFVFNIFKIYFKILQFWENVLI